MVTTVEKFGNMYERLTINPHISIRIQNYWTQIPTGWTNLTGSGFGQTGHPAGRLALPGTLNQDKNVTLCLLCRQEENSKPVGSGSHLRCVPYGTLRE